MLIAQNGDRIVPVDSVTSLHAIIIIIIIIAIFYTPGSKDPPGLKTTKAKIKMSDGQRSGMSTGRVSFKSTELKRCSMIEMRWNKYEVSLAYHV